MDDEGVSFILINDIQYFSVIFSNKKGSFSFHTLFFYVGTYKYFWHPVSRRLMF